MSNYLIKEFILVYLITSIVINLPNVQSSIMFYFKTILIFLIGILFVIKIYSNKNLEFFYKNSGSLLTLCLLAAFFYNFLTLTPPSFLLFSIIFIIFFVFFGRNIGVENLKLGLFSTISLILINLLLLRVCLSGLFEIFNHNYYINDLSLELKNIGYNVGRTGWAISVIFLICFLKIFKRQLSNNSKIKNILLSSTITLGSICVFLSDSRTGIIALLILLIIWNYEFFNKFIKPKFIFYLFLAFEILIILIGIASIISVLENTRLATFNSGDDISNGRFEGTLIGLEIIKNNFIMGTYPIKSYDLKDYGMAYSEIHVLWLNLMALYGVPLITFIIFSLMYLIIRSVRFYYRGKVRYNNLDSKTFIFLVVFGLFVSFFEPNGIISFISFVAIYWFTLGLCFNIKSFRNV
ncbi:O-antigen ligase family protein [Acinetobacter sp. WCHA39]|uniref:O-antigen ligase family protein n=1 Tax=Acinetobacter sp. WCHA39 TaxID=2004648 RepID=UPI00148DEA6A|nr:O-antigen ligase family protein [Acinetobacter sp. WCHA39]